MKVLRTEKDILELEHGDKILVYHKIKKKLILCNVVLEGGTVSLTIQQKIASMIIAYSKSHMIERMNNNRYMCAGYYIEAQGD